MAQFSLSKVPSPAKSRPPHLFPNQDTKYRKIAKVDEIVNVQQGPRPPIPRVLPAKGDIVATLYKYSDDAKTIWETCKEDGLSLWQVQIQHECRDSICFQVQERFHHYLQSDPSLPQNTAELQEKALIKLVVATSDDEESVGFKQWRVAFYVAGKDDSALQNLMYLLDGFWAFFTTGKTEYANVILHPHTNVNIDECWDHFQYPVYQLEEASEKLPMGIFEAYPPQGKRIVQMTIQVESGELVSFIFHGATWPFRNAFETVSVPGYKDNHNIYYRAIKSMNVSSQDGPNRINNILEGVLRNLAIRVTIDGHATVESAVHAFIRILRKRPNLHFV